MSPGRDFEIAVDITTSAMGATGTTRATRAENGGWTTLRIAVSDARGELRLPAADMPPPLMPRLAENGRGMLLVRALADRWDVIDRPPVGKTVVAELDLPPGVGQGA